MPSHRQARRRALPRGRAWRTLTTRWVLPAAGTATLAVAGVAAVSHHDAAVAHVNPAAASVPMSASRDTTTVSRSDPRPPIPAHQEAKVTGSEYALDDLDVHTAASDTSVTLSHVSKGKTVEVTGKTSKGWTQIVLDGAPRWVSSADVSADKPLSFTPCASGDAVEKGLRPDTVRVHRAVCAQFPQITTYYGLGAREDHATGRAIDIMVFSDTSLGYTIAEYARSHYRELGISQVIWHQHIWTVQRASEGWRAMPDRGSPTANHMDHVHVSTYGDVGTA